MFLFPFDVQGVPKKMLHTTHKEEISQLDCLDNHLNWKVEPWMGMVRVSFGLYNTKDDVDHFIYALKEIITKKDEYEKYYIINEHGDYEHLTFQFSCKDYFNLSQLVLDELDA